MVTVTFSPDVPVASSRDCARDESKLPIVSHEVWRVIDLTPFVCAAPKWLIRVQGAQNSLLEMQTGRREQLRPGRIGKGFSQP